MSGLNLGERALAFVCVGVALVGCQAHVVLPPPPDPATSSETLRQEYFEANRALPATREQRAARTRMFESTPVFLQKSIALRNGAEVHHVEDLRPLVADDSLAAQAIDVAVARGADARLITTSAGITSGVGVLSGLATLTLGIMGVDTDDLLPPLRFGEDNSQTIPGYVLYGGGTALVTLAIGTGLAVWGSSANDDAAEARAQAFSLFDDGLRQRLGLPPLGAVSTNAPTSPADMAPVDVTPPE